MNESAKRFLIVMFVIAYVIWPIDLCPGLVVDDIILVLAAAISQKRKAAQS